MKNNRVKVAMLMTVMAMGSCFLPHMGINVYASENPEQIVSEYVKAMDEQDWDKFTSLYCEEVQQDLSDFFNDVTSEEEHQGVWNVESAELTEIVEINMTDACDIRK